MSEPDTPERNGISRRFAPIPTDFLKKDSQTLNDLRVTGLKPTATRRLRKSKTDICKNLTVANKRRRCVRLGRRLTRFYNTESVRPFL